MLVVISVGATQFDFNNRSLDDYAKMYRSSWIAKRGINVPAYDAIRAWRSWTADEDVIKKLTDGEKKLNLRRHVYLALIYARLYGGAAIYIVHRSQCRSTTHEHDTDSRYN